MVCKKPAASKKTTKRSGPAEAKDSNSASPNYIAQNVCDEHISGLSGLPRDYSGPDLEPVPPPTSKPRCTRFCWPCRLVKKQRQKCCLKANHGITKDGRQQLPCCHCETCFAEERRGSAEEFGRGLIQSAR